jgi:hypothetical protein
MKKSYSIVLILSLLAIALHQAPAQSFAPASKPISSGEVERTVVSIISQMTLEEKIDLLGGIDCFFVRVIQRLNLPRLKMAVGGVLPESRAAAVRRGRYLEYFTICYNSLEGLIPVRGGLIAGSIALVGFGFDSLIEVTSGTVLLWRLRADVDEARREQVEAISLRIVGACFVVLAIYVTYDSVKSLLDPTGRRKV